MMVIERFYFSAGGHIKTIFFTKKTLDKSIKIEGFALKMMTFFTIQEQRDVEYVVPKTKSQ